MAEHKEHESGQSTKGIGGSDPRQHSESSTGRGESNSAREESRRGVAQGSTSGGRSSNESDSDMRGNRESGNRESGTHRPGHGAQPDEVPLTMGSNGGGREDNQPAGTDTGRKPRGTESHEAGTHAGTQNKEHRKAS